MTFCSSVLLTLPGIYCSPFDKPKSTKDHWSSCCFHSPCFLYPYFKIFILWELFYYFQKSVPFHRDRHANEQAHFVWSVWFYLFVNLDWHFPEYSLFLVLLSLSLIHICSIYLALGSCRVCIICPLEICCSFVVSLYVLCLGKFRTSRDKVVNCFSLEIACKFCTLGQCHLSEPGFSSTVVNL